MASRFPPNAGSSSRITTSDTWRAVTASVSAMARTMGRYSGAIELTSAAGSGGPAVVSNPEAASAVSATCPSGTTRHVTRSGPG